MIQIKLKFSTKVLYESEKAENIRECLFEALKEGADLEGADLRGAYLRGAYLRGADLEGAKHLASFQAGNSNRLCIAVKHEAEVKFQIGCFWGNAKDAIVEIKEKYGENSYYEKIVKIYDEMLMEK